ncbi:MAG: hypothetical protein COZ21_13005 [Bacteroidetes bacterium CG_4_10_14_3_um_filter_31_20]|nr:MAG: hypothetical protein COZ21_13005 [Bacteroidetes bacterium CG_4_10_14_3_um_filter_31_20]
MELTFNTLIDLIKNLSVPEKEEIKFIIERNIAEESRSLISKNYLNSQKEFKKGKLKFTGNIDELKKML